MAPNIYDKQQTFTIAHIVKWKIKKSMQFLEFCEN